MAAMAGDDHPPRSVQVSASHSIKTMPDMAVLSLSAYAENVVLDAAKKDADAQLAAIKKIMQQHEVPATHINTETMRINPRYQYRINNKREFETYEVSYQINVRIKALEHIAAMMQRLTEAGITHINGLNYGLENSESLKDDALREAVKKARVKAALMAQAAQATLGDVLTLSEGQSYSQPPMMERAMLMSADKSYGGEAPPVGEMDVTASVTATYELDD